MCVKGECDLKWEDLMLDVEMVISNGTIITVSLTDTNTHDLTFGISSCRSFCVWYTQSRDVIELDTELRMEQHVNGVKCRCKSRK